MADHVNGHINAALPEGVLPPLASLMAVDFLIDENSKVLILHDRSFADALQWLEYDQDSNQVTFVYEGGQMQALGLVIPRVLQERLLKSAEAFTMHIMNGQKQALLPVPIMVREKMFH